MLLSAVLVLLLALALIGLAIYFARGTRFSASLACLLLAGLSIHLYAASEHELHEWDERFHAVVATHLIEHPLTPTLYDDPVRPYDYRDWMANHVWLHKPPLALWLMAASLRVVGISELGARLPSVLLSTLAIALTYAIGRRLFDPLVGLTAAAFHAVNGLLVALASGRAPTDHVDAILIVLIELGVYLAMIEVERPGVRLQLLIGAVIGLAVLTKWYPGLMIVPVWLYLARRRSLTDRLIATALMLACAFAIVAPWAWHIYRSYPAEAVWEWRYGLSHATDVLEERRGGPLFYFASLPKFLGELVYIPIAAAIVAAARGTAALRPLLLWTAIPYAIFSVAATKMPAYVMIAAPAIFLIEAWFWWELASMQRLARHRVLRVAVLLVFAVLPMRYVLRPGGPFTLQNRHPQWVSDIEALRGQIHDARPVLFNMPRPIETMFYLSSPAYGDLPSAEEVAALKLRGYSVLVYDGGRLRQP